MATPHVAGAAALLLQLHPEWTPDNVKSAMANTSLDLGYDAYTQGAGRIQLLPAANTSAVATPSSLGFGLDDLTLDLWEVSETLTLSNLSDSTVTYTVALESDLPAGVTITADRSSVVLGPGESAEVIVGLSVDNTVVPNPPEQPFSYEGAVVATSEDETLRVPFSFIKSPVINFTFDENPWIVLVHNRGGKSIFLANPGTSLQLPVPRAGTYDVIVTFNDVAIRVVVEGLEVETATEVDIFTTHATHEITIAPVDSDGRPLSLGIGGEYFTHKDSGQGLIFIFGFPMERHFSDISNAYSWEWTITESDRRQRGRIQLQRVRQRRRQRRHAIPERTVAAQENDLRLLLASRRREGQAPALD